MANGGEEHWRTDCFLSTCREAVTAETVALPCGRSQLLDLALLPAPHLRMKEGKDSAWLGRCEGDSTSSSTPSSWGEAWHEVDTWRVAPLTYSEALELCRVPCAGHHL